MKVISSHVGDITNFEVQEILKANKIKNVETRKGLMGTDLRQAQTIEEQVTNFLTKSPIGGIDFNVAKEILMKLTTYPIPFSKQDQLQILNNLPRKEVDLFLALSRETYAEIEKKALVQKIIEDISQIVEQAKNETG